MSFTRSHTNRLIHEKSPYLQLHAHNPVDWYPWGDEAFQKALSEDKLLIISIGYSACHWCHVMEKEAFSDPDVARLMNKHFVSVKVDREERPDIDLVYMDAVQLITGRGGWPLNAIALPDGKPVYAGTYFPREKWIDVLSYVHKEYATNKNNLLEQATEIMKGIASSGSYFIRPVETDVFTMDRIHEMVENWMNNIDFTYGGNNMVPKFPMPAGYEFLLHYHHLTDDRKSFLAIKTTLDRMSMGGIYDHAGGGFARYSTDSYWKVPHFEKMLYDNAQLVSLYSNAFRLTKAKEYLHVVRETFDFIKREMTSAEGAFYSAIDADSEGKEGTYYLWSWDEIKSIITSDQEHLAGYYNINPAGNWKEGLNILYNTVDADTYCSRKGISVARFSEQKIKFKSKLLLLRHKRIKPLTDTKIITSWNALMIKGYLDAFHATDDFEYLQTALKTTHFLLRIMTNDDCSLYRNFKNGKSYTPAMLDDYAHLIQTLISLYQSTFDEKWLKLSVNFLEYTLMHFHDKSSGLFYYTSDLQATILIRKLELTDNVIPSSNSVMAHNLFILGMYFERSEWIQHARTMVHQVAGNFAQSGTYFANWARLYLLLANTPFEVAITGESCHEKQREILNHFLPDVLLSGSIKEGSLPVLQHKLVKNRTSIYVCRNRTCKLPVASIESALEQINQDRHN